jgi:hypothetical protein
MINEPEALATGVSLIFFAAKYTRYNDNTNARR